MIDELADLGINTIALFPNIKSDLKDIHGSEALKEDNLNLLNIDEYNIDEVLITEKEEYWKKANKEGRSK